MVRLVGAWKVISNVRTSVNSSLLYSLAHSSVGGLPQIASILSERIGFRLLQRRTVSRSAFILYLLESAAGHWAFPLRRGVGNQQPRSPYPRAACATVLQLSEISREFGGWRSHSPHYPGAAFADLHKHLTPNFPAGKVGLP